MVKSKGFQVLFLLIMMGFLISISWSFSLKHTPLSPFELQTQYATQVEKKLKRLLEPATGIGNVQTSVQAEITHKNIIQKNYNPFTMTETTVHQKGPVLEKQSISVLVNEKNKERIYAYQNLIKAAVGYDPERGDQLAIEMLPFVKAPIWTFGLTPLCLMRIAGILVLLIITGVFYLVKTKIKKPTIPPCESNTQLWKEVEKVEAKKLAGLLQKKRPEIVAVILHHLSIEKASELMEYFSDAFKNQVSLHLDQIEKWGIPNYLLKQAEKRVYEILKELAHKKNNPFIPLCSWKDSEIQELLRYVSKSEFIKAVKEIPEADLNIFRRNIPPALWQEMITEAKLNPTTKEESQKAQNNILKLANLLKKGQ